MELYCRLKYYEGKIAQQQKIHKHNHKQYFQYQSQRMFKDNCEYEQFLFSLTERDLDFWEFDTLPKEDLKVFSFKCITAIKKIGLELVQCRQMCQQLEQQIELVKREREELVEHNNVLQEQCYGFRVMVNDLEEEKDRKIQQISYSQSEFKNTCLEISVELESQRNLNFSLINTEKELLKKVRQLEGFQNQLSKKNRQSNEILSENHVLKRELAEARKLLSNVQSNCQHLKEQNFQFKEEIYQLKQRCHDYKEENKYLIENVFVREELREEDEEMKKQILPCCHEEYYEKDKINEISQSFMKDSHRKKGELVRMMSRNESENSLKRDKTDEKKKQSIFQSEYKESREQECHKNSISDMSISIVEGLKLSAMIQNKYEKELKHLKKERKKMKMKIKQMQYEKVIKMDTISQLEGQLEMKDDHYQLIIDDLTNSLKIEKNIAKNTRNELYSQKLLLSEEYNELSQKHKQLQSEFKKSKTHYSSLQKYLKTYQSSIESIMNEYQRQIAKLLDVIEKHKVNEKRQQKNSLLTIHSNTISQTLQKLPSPPIQESVQTSFETKQIYCQTDRQPEQINEALENPYKEMYLNQSIESESSSVSMFYRSNSSSLNIENQIQFMKGYSNGNEINSNPFKNSMRYSKKPHKNEGKENNPHFMNKQSLLNMKMKESVDLSSVKEQKTKKQTEIFFYKQEKGKLQNLIGKKLTVEKQFSQVLGKDFWKLDKLYICEAKIEQINFEDQIAIWKSGLYSIKLKQGLRMKGNRRNIEDKGMVILGNCQIRIEGSKICCRREGKKNFFEGDLPDYTWQVSKAVTFSYD